MQMVQLLFYLDKNPRFQVEMGEVGGAHLEEEVVDLSHQLTNLRDSLVPLTSKTEVRNKADKKAGRVPPSSKPAVPPGWRPCAPC